MRRRTQTYSEFERENRLQILHHRQQEHSSWGHTRSRAHNRTVATVSDETELSRLEEAILHDEATVQRWQASIEVRPDPNTSAKIADTTARLADKRTRAADLKSSVEDIRLKMKD